MPENRRHRIVEREFFLFRRALLFVGTDMDLANGPPSSIAYHSEEVVFERRIVPLS